MASRPSIWCRVGILGLVLGPVPAMALWSPDLMERDPSAGMPAPAKSWHVSGAPARPTGGESLAALDADRRAELLKGLSERLQAGSLLDRAAWTRSSEVVEAPFLAPHTPGKPVLYSLVDVDKAAQLVSGMRPEGPTRDALGRPLTGITIPEPATAWLLLAAGAAWGAWRRSFTRDV